MTRAPGVEGSADSGHTLGTGAPNPRRAGGSPRGPFGFPDVLTRVGRRLMDRLTQLEQQLDDGDEAPWPAYLATLDALLRVAAQTTPGGRGELLTTAAMADRLGISPKTLLKHKAERRIVPALQRGKLIRWRGSEALR